VDRADGTAEYGIGSGIVWDSEAGDEYDECLLKARILATRPRKFSLLETLAWTPDEGYVLFDRHLRRLSDSATYFGVPLDLEAVRERLTSAATGLGTAPAVVRLTVAPDGAVDVSTSPRVESNAPVRLALAPTPVASSDPFLFHKTTERAVYEAARAARPGSDDVVLWNERGEVTETTIANLVVRIDDAWWTPPVSSGLLAGTFRAALLDEGRVRERVIPVEVLSESGSIAVVNSVRGWRAAIIKT
jgi:para-aminobenzoate synthetase/4-amino-4-deoxychorismate lyase